MSPAKSPQTQRQRERSRRNRIPSRQSSRRDQSSHQTPAGQRSQASNFQPEGHGAPAFDFPGMASTPLAFNRFPAGPFGAFISFIPLQQGNAAPAHQAGPGAVGRSEQHGRSGTKPGGLGPKNAGISRRRADKPGGRLKRSRAKGAGKLKACGNCNKEGHFLADCAHPAPDGYVHGCPFCNTKDHELDGCGYLQRPTSIWSILRWAVTRRANRPALAVFHNWMELVRDAPKHRRPRPVDMPERFPWTPKFCQQLMERGHEPWVDFDYSRDASALVADPVTANMERVMGNYAEIQRHDPPLPWTDHRSRSIVPTPLSNHDDLRYIKRNHVGSASGPGSKH